MIRISRTFLAAAFVVSVALSAALAQPVRPNTAAFSILPPSPKEMSTLCTGTDDLRECGKRVEAAQLKSAQSVVSRRGKLLSVTLTESGAVHFLDEGGAEGGESFSFFAYSGAADAVTLYHTKADKLGFIVVLRKSGEGSAVPNEPIFSSSGADFLTVDACKRECEQRVTWWRTGGDVVRRHAEFIVAASTQDAQAAWTPNGSIWLELTIDDKKQTTELLRNDKRWTFASPN